MLTTSIIGSTTLIAKLSWNKIISINLIESLRATPCICIYEMCIFIISIFLLLNHIFRNIYAPAHIWLLYLYDLSLDKDICGLAYKEIYLS